MENIHNKRRQFIKNSGSLMAGLALSPSLLSCANRQGLTNKKQDASMTSYKDDIGIQLWSVRDQLKENPQKTLSALKACGYSNVEPMSTELMMELQPMLSDMGLGVHSSHFMWMLITENWEMGNMEKPAYGFEKVVEDAHKQGLSELVFAYWLPQERTNLDDYKSLVDKLNNAGELCSSAGIQLCYHNHSFEWQPMEGSNGFEVLMSRLDPKYLQFELDVFWASLAGQDPVELMTEYSNKIRLVHLKDKKAHTPVILDESKTPPEAFQALGKGSIDIAKSTQKAMEIGVPYLIVEQDHSTQILDDVCFSNRYLKSDVLYQF